MSRGAVFADLAAAVADGADCIDGVGQACGDREHVFGPAASTTTMWRLVDERVDTTHLPGIRAARASARAAAWAAGAAAAAGQWLHLDVDATITIDHSDDKQQAAPTWKKTWGHHPLLVFLDRPEIAGSNTAADHVTVLRWALDSLPEAYRPNPEDPGAQQILVRSDSAGATHTVADACRAAGVEFSFGYAVDARVRDAVEILNAADGWYPAIDSGGGIREGAWVAEATSLVAMSGWPTGTRLVLRKERPHPGAKISSALKGAGRQRNVETRATEIQAILRREHLTAPPAVAAAFGATTTAAVHVIAALNAQIAELEAVLAAHFDKHPDADIYRSLPGLGVVLGARVLGEFGDDPNRYSTAKCRKNYAGTSPLTIASGRKRAVLARHVRNRRLYDALDQWAFCALTRSPGARAFYDQRCGNGDTHHQALRALGNRLVGILHGCLRHHAHYDERKAWAHRMPAAA